jgi:hypothetical protein
MGTFHQPQIMQQTFEPQQSYPSTFQSWVNRQALQSGCPSISPTHTRAWFKIPSTPSRTHATGVGVIVFQKGLDMCSSVKTSGLFLLSSMLIIGRTCQPTSSKRRFITYKYSVKVTHVLFFNVNVQPQYSVFPSSISFTASRVQHLRSAIMDLHMLFAGMFDFDSASDCTKYTDSFQDMNAFTLIIENDQAKPACGSDQSVISNQKSALHEATTIGNGDNSEKDVSQSDGVHVVPQDPIKYLALKPEPSPQPPRTYGILDLFSCQ